MINKLVKKTLIYSELDDFSEFEFKQKKYLFNYDNIYYTVKLNNDKLNDVNDNISKLINYLKFNQEKLNISNFDFIELFDDLKLTYGRFDRYCYNLNYNDKFNIYISDFITSNDFPRIFVQIRSKPIWTINYYDIFNESLNVLKSFLNNFNIKFIDENININRLDYAFHTNFIQSPLNFFNDDNLSKYLNFKGKYHKVGYFNSRTGDKVDISIDYLALGSRKRDGSGVFFRIYNKTCEVIEKGYKSFFFDIWLENELISKYDYFCFNLAYLKRKYGYIHYARALYYISNGKDDFVKLKLNNMIKSKISYSDMEKYLDDNKIVPKVSVILNFEFEVKRRFFRQTKEFVKLSKKENEFEYNFILNNPSFYVDFLTSKFLYFGTREIKRQRKNNQKREYIVKYNDFWYHLRKTQIFYNNKLFRTYKSNVDIKRLFNTFKSNVASINSVVFNDINSDINDDIWNVLNYFNDNDLYDDYQELKKKKKEYYKNKIVSDL